jgi:hypothetical protein
VLLRQAMVVAWVGACASGHSADGIRSGLRRTCSDDGSNRNTSSDNRDKVLIIAITAPIIAIRELGAPATLTATPTAAASRIWARLNRQAGAAQSCTHSPAVKGNLSTSLSSHCGCGHREQSKGTAAVDKYLYIRPLGGKHASILYRRSRMR